jgi:antitoxin VapB
MLSRIFKSGNSQAVRIPKELAFDTDMLDVEVVRKGETLVIRAISHQSLADVMKAFAAFPRGFMSEGRDMNEQRPRSWDVKQVVRSKKAAR